MSKFKVGDKVEIKIGLKEGQRGNKANVTRVMARMCGKSATVVRIDNEGDIILDINPLYAWDTDWINHRREFIVIRRSGAETIAELRHDREVIKSAKATCAPSDTFDFDTGAKLAFDRLMGREAFPCRIIKAEYKEEPTKPQRTWVENEQAARRSNLNVGDRVDSRNDEGIGTVVGFENDGVDWVYVHFDKYPECYTLKFEKNLRLVKRCNTAKPTPQPSPAPEPPKYYTGKVVMTACKYPDREPHIGRLFEFKDGKYVGAEVLGFWFFAEPYKSFNDIAKNHNTSTWIEVKE